MQIHLNTDTNIQGRESLAAWIDGELKGKLDRFREYLTRVDVHLSDASATREGAEDVRCKLEARLGGRPPVLVSHDAAKVPDAFHGALDKLARAVDAAVEKSRDNRSRESIRGDFGEAGAADAA